MMFASKRARLFAKVEERSIEGVACVFFVLGAEIEMQFTRLFRMRERTTTRSFTRGPATPISNPVYSRLIPLEQSQIFAACGFLTFASIPDSWQAE
jgi:hypothetical protein